MSASFKLFSAAFDSGEEIPRQHGCDGDGTSPPLSWSHPPARTRSLALVVDDPDAPGKTFVHWLLFNLPPDRTALPAGVVVGTEFRGSDPAPLEGANDFGNSGYGGPCPPPGPPHRYAFRLYALDRTLGLGPGVVREQLADAMAGHVLAEADLFGTYARRR